MQTIFDMINFENFSTSVILGLHEIHSNINSVFLTSVHFSELLILTNAKFKNSKIH